MHDTAKFSGLFDTIINAATAVLPFIRGSGGSSTQGQAKGLAAIRAYVQNLLQGLEQIKTQVAALSLTQRQQVAQQIAAQVNEIVSTLTNPQYVYQAKKGDDAKALQDGIRLATLKAQEIGALLTNQSVDTTPVTGTPVGMPNPTPIEQNPVIVQQGIDAKDLMIYGGIGLAVLLLLKK